MLDVLSLKNFDIFKNFDLIAGANGLYRTVTNVVILDYEGIEEDYHGFHEGDFVITNLMFAKRHPQRIFNSFKELISIGVSAFAIKTVFFSELPEEVIHLANEKQVPIFLFNDVFIEDVILNITDYLRSSTNYNYFENIIDTFVNPVDNSEGVAELTSALNIDTSVTYCSSLYLCYKDNVDKYTFQRALNKLQIQIQHLVNSNNIKLVQYKQGILFIELFSDPGEIPAKLKAHWLSILNELTITLDNFYLGINDTSLEINKLDISIQRSLNACKQTIHLPNDITTYQELQTSNLYFAFQDNAYIKEYFLEVVRKIQPECTSLSSFTKTDIYNVLKACVECHFDIEATAAALFQHPNTIRYHLKKTKSQLALDDEVSYKMLLMCLINSLNY